MTMDLSLNIQGDSSDAQAALSELSGKLDEFQGSIDSVDPSPLGDAQTALDGVGTAGDTAATGLEDVGTAGDAAGAGALEAQAGVEQAYASLENLSTVSEEAAGSLENVGAAAGDASSGLSDAGSAASDAGSELSNAGAGMNELSSSLGTLDSGLGGVTSDLGDMVDALGEGPMGLATAGAAAVAVIGGLASAGASWASEQMKIEDVLGMSAYDAELYSNALGDVGSSGQRLITMGYMLEKRLEAVALQIQAGKSPSNALTQAMDALGVTWHDTSGNMLSMGVILPDLLNKLGTMSDKTKAAQLSTQLFGKAGADIIPLIANYSQVMAVATSQTEASGLAEKDATALSLQYDEATTTLGIHMHELGAVTLPLLSGAVQASAFVLGGWADIAGWVEKGLGAVKGAVDTTDTSVNTLTGDTWTQVAAERALEYETYALTHGYQGLADAQSAAFAGRTPPGYHPVTGEDALPSWANPSAGRMQSYDIGGVVPGSPGQPQVAVVHGGETIVPAGKTGGTVINNYGRVTNNFPTHDAARAAMREVDRLFRGS